MDIDFQVATAATGRLGLKDDEDDAIIRVRG